MIASPPPDLFAEGPCALQLADITEADRPLTGSKAAALAGLARLGFNVPDGFVLTTDAFARYCAVNGFGGESTPEAVAAAAMPEDVAGVLRAGLAALGGGPLAV